MKRILSFFFMSFILIQFSFAQDDYLIIQGHVYDTMTGDPVPNHIVTAEIMSAGMVTTLEMMTNNWGMYGDTTMVSEYGDVTLSTYDCMGIPLFYSTYFAIDSSDYIYHDFFICYDTLFSGCTAGFYYELPPDSSSTVFFTNTSSGSPDGWYWNFGDGTTSSEFEPVHQYNALGEYTVCLTMWSADSSCYDSYCEDITIGTLPDDCQNYFWYESWDQLSFTFMGESQPFPADYYHWDFGDGNTGSGQETEHIYEAADTSLLLVVTLTTYTYNPATGDTCVAQSSQDVWIGNNSNDCSNSFWYESSDSYSFEFFGEGWPEATDYFWDFGDGQSAIGQNVIHTYEPTTSGEVNVTLTTLHSTAGAADSCIAFSSQFVLVGDSLGGCQNFFWYMPSGDYSYTFSGESFPEAEYFFWDFGDGSTDWGQEVDHTFDPNQGDLFTVSLITAHLTPAGDTCMAESVQEVLIDNGNWDCNNWFWYQSDDYITFNFFGEAFPIPADGFYWDFGDGSVAYDSEVSHTYEANPGDVFLVTLFTWGMDPITYDSCFAESVQEIVIGGIIGGCENFFWYESGNDFTFEFHGESLPFPADEYYWDFGDGTFASGQDVVHSFDPNNGSIFEVCLSTYMIINSDSCIAQSCQSVSLDGESGVEVFGSIYVDGEPADAALVGLFGADPNSFYYEFTLTQAETGSYFFENVPEGDYYIFTSLTPQSTEFFDYFPTYYGDAIFWFDADLLSFGTPENPYDVNLEPITAITSGPGIISGTVTMEDGKGDPGENITVVLLDGDDNPLDYAQTDETGEFTFEDLAYGTYKLKIEMPGVNSEIALVWLSEDNEMTELQFFVKDNSAYLGLKNSLEAISAIGEVFPNPVTGLGKLDVMVKTPTDMIIQIINHSGQLLNSYNKSFNAGLNILEIETSSFASGLYYVQIIDDSGQSITRKFIK